MLNNNDKILRCAIYTRKSSEKGLELEYNSLEFQYNRCLEYINSQPNLMFVKKYEDAGISGKDTTHRPGFLQMMKDVENKNIDCIIVYKLDRLSRSIVDLANLVEHLQDIDAQFISVTQQIDTSNSCGKLSFNMLAAIAQFEREIASERVRDKVASAKIQGLWCGGIVPVGYKAVNKKLEVVPKDAEIIQYIYKEFLQGKSIYSITKSLIAEKRKTSKNKFLNINSVHHILRNPIYIGKISYKGILYNGLQKAIIDYDTWEKASELLDGIEKLNKKNSSKRKIITDSLLTGLVYCGDCNKALSPTHSKKKNLNYRYYECLNYKHGFNNDCSIRRINADQIEGIVLKEVFKLLTSETMVGAVANQSINLSSNEIQNCCKNIEKIWDVLLAVERRKIVLSIINRVTLYCNQVEIEIKTNSLEKVISEALHIELNKVKENKIFTISIPINLQRIKSQTVVISSDDGIYKPTRHHIVNHLLINLALAWKWKRMLDTKEYDNLKQISSVEEMDTSLVYKIFKFNFLAPDIVDYIVNHPECNQFLSIRELSRLTIPLLWEEQREFFYPILKGEKAIL